MKILLLNQAFWPDVVASAQQLTMLARRLSERGHQVTVITGARGYDDATASFPRREKWHSIDIVRISCISAGKKHRWQRTLNFASFLFACAARLIAIPRQDVVIALTSPPLISWLGSLFIRIKRGELIFWPLDLNPDEAMAAGWLKESSFTAKFLSRLLNSSMARAKTIIALDDFMKERIVAKGISRDKIDVIPPAPDDAVSYDEEGREAFRRAHDIADKFVVMYAGNHSPCHPLDTLLLAAQKSKHREEIVFLFVGGGSEVAKVQSFARLHELRNIRHLPYQPQAELSALLSAADLHVVVMGEGFAGIVHPSKIYNILKVRAPFLFIGPEAGFVSDIVAALPRESVAMRAQHGHVEEVVTIISSQADRHLEGRSRPIASGYDFSITSGFSRFIAHVEALNPQPSPARFNAVGTSADIV
ncbi:MAG TPA: glycosyltransferase family 4 protein [Pyrinomonadaceae bacterium]